MAFIKNNPKYEIGTWVTTTRKHSSMCGTFTKGSRVKIIAIDPIRGYAIEDEHGNKMVEIGGVI